MILTYTGTEDSPGDALVRITIDELAFLRFEVELYGLPENRWVGHEVTVNFFSPDIDNLDTFYTDANGLEMQTRKINYRPTWDLTLPTNQNISANYYPVSSAIAIRDEAVEVGM